MRRYLGRLALALSLGISGCGDKHGTEGLVTTDAAVAFSEQVPTQTPAQNEVLPSESSTLASIIDVELPVIIPTGQEIKVDISDKFIPELIAQSSHAQKYLTAEGVFADPEQRERFGLFSSFEYRTEKLRHFHDAALKAGNEVPLSFNTKETLTKTYTTPKTLEEISELETLGVRTKKQEDKLATLKTKVENVKAIQQRLTWEGFYEGGINGDYSSTITSVKEFQKYHRLDVDGKLGKNTRNTILQPLQEKELQAHANLMHVFEERIFHATYIIDQSQLHTLTESAAKELKIDTIDGALKFFEKKDRGTTLLHLQIPELYQNQSLDLQVKITKSEQNRKNSKLQLFAHEGGRDILLYETRVVVGGKNDVRGHMRDFDTPVGEYYLKRIVVFPYWHPPDWAEEKYGEPSTQPGPLNAYGMLMAEYFKNKKAPDDPYEGWLSGDAKIRIHLTASPGSVESGYGASHGCTRLHPADGSRFFYFINHFTLHHEMRGFSLRGDLVPFQKGHYIPVSIKE